MTSPAASPSPSPSASVHDDPPAPQTEYAEHQSPSDEVNESPEPEPSASAPSQASNPTTSVTGPAASTAPLAVGIATASAGDWQAVWSPQHNTYYFYNSKTQETTWTNPLESEASSSTAASPPSDPGASASASTSSMYALQAAAAAQGIDPSLAYLDPSLAASTSSNPQAFTYTAKFNARTGTFARPDARDPTHVSEYERAKRMSEVYFDVGQWEKDLEEQEESEGKKRKRPTKKDLVCDGSRMIGCFVYPNMTRLFAGEVQGAEAAEEDSQDGVAAYIVPYTTHIHFRLLMYETQAAIKRRSNKRSLKCNGRHRPRLDGTYRKQWWWGRISHVC